MLVSARQARHILAVFKDGVDPNADPTSFDSVVREARKAIEYLTADKRSPR